jgi:predicted PurR-regulated permease PerM
VTLISLLGLVALAGWFTTDRLLGEIDQLSERLPRAASQLMDRVKSYDLARRVLDEAPSPERLIREPRDFVQRATGVVSSTVSVVTSAFVILFIGLYLAFDQHILIEG